MDQSNLEAYIRNTDLYEVVKADIILVRFDGLELESGTVVEYMLAKSLGKPTVILRSDFRSVTYLPECEPYNLRAKNWPRNVEVYFHSFQHWAALFFEEIKELDNSESLQELMKAEIGSLKRSVDEVARLVIPGLEAVLKIESPYPPEYREVVYRASRFYPGSGFDQMLTATELEKIIQRLRKNGTL